MKNDKLLDYVSPDGGKRIYFRLINYLTDFEIPQDVQVKYENDKEGLTRFIDSLRMAVQEIPEDSFPRICLWDVRLTNEYAINNKYIPVKCQIAYFEGDRRVELPESIGIIHLEV